MKPLLPTLALMTVLALSGCATGQLAGAGNAIMGRDRYAYTEVYYDDHYGPLYSGFWGPDQKFYYSTAAGRPHFADNGRHVRRQDAEGFREVRVPDRMHVAGPARTRQGG